ncbi:PTS sugar transporter subunit IIA [Clostridioides difficile]|uniref:PTS sugar transporter subunit IIA n=1 Tax=Clostridioides difficile TaxID=1496 RepID=UPI00097FFC75|nr:PTS sugar transporter subunit IIA [Clostridioides difficile]SJO45116.1 EIIBCA-Man [Clostridioides difficile]HBF4252098.1 PTS sugar transporter subunit IIA [Clostridioides difficile]
MEIREILTEESIILDLKSTTKEDIIQELVDKLYYTGSITLKSKFIKALKRREKIGSTSIGYQMAMPHGKTKYVKKASVVIGKSEKGVDWPSIDGLPVKVIIMFAIPQSAGNEDMILISKIAYILGGKNISERLLNAHTKKEILDIFYEV